MSRGFICTLAGIAITIFAWFSPWAWPAWPALTGLDLAFTPDRPFATLAPWAKTLVMAGLIALNVAFWSGLCRAIVEVILRERTDGSDKSDGSC